MPEPQPDVEPELLELPSADLKKILTAEKAKRIRLHKEKPQSDEWKVQCTRCEALEQLYRHRLRNDVQQPSSSDQEPRTDTPSPKALDRVRQAIAEKIGDGHRIVYGVAGSGKTIFLIERARLLAEMHPVWKILVLCYNVTLASWLRHKLKPDQKSLPSVSVLNFHAWAQNNGCHWHKDMGDGVLADELFRQLTSGMDARAFDAVLIDEAQDFHPSWFECVLKALRDPVKSDLVIVGDGSQGLYRKGDISWSKLGIRARGRSYYSALGFDRNYRNTKEILEAAALFATHGNVDEDDDTISAPPVDPEKAQRSGVRPILVSSDDEGDECETVIRLVQELLAGNFGKHTIAPLQASEICVLYPIYQDHVRDLEKDLLRCTGQRVVWLTQKQDLAARRRVCDDGMKLQTIHSSRGLQYKAVILMSAHILPHLPTHDSYTALSDRIAGERRLMYVGLTRPEEYLAVSYIGPQSSSFTDEMVKSGKFDPI